MPLPIVSGAETSNRGYIPALIGAEARSRAHFGLEGGIADSDEQG